MKEYLKNKGCNIKKEWFVLTPSVGAPIYSIYNLIPKNTQVIIPTPIYINFLKAPKHLKRKVQKLPMVNDKGRLVIDFNKLSSIANKNSWLMFVNPQNPEAPFIQKRIKKPFKNCQRKNITVFSDELHCDLILQKILNTLRWVL